MKTLTAEQQLQNAAATTCELCHGQFIKKNKKTKHHCHLRGLYIGPYCNTCNLKLKYKKGPNSDPTKEKKKKALKMKQTKFFNGTLKKFIKNAEDVARDNDDLDTADYMMTEDSYMIPVIFHNLKGYDPYLIFQYVTREYAPNSIDVIPTTSEKFLRFQIGNLRFLDSLQFLSTSLDTLVHTLAADGSDKFSHTARHCSDSDLVFANGKLPLRIHGWKRQIFVDQASPIDAFYSSLSEETITSEEYKVWQEFKFKNMQQYHDLYLNLDVFS